MQDAVILSSVLIAGAALVAHCLTQPSVFLFKTLRAAIVQPKGLVTAGGNQLVQVRRHFRRKIDGYSELVSGNARDSLKQALTDLDYVEMDDGAWMLPVLRFSSPGKPQSPSVSTLHTRLIVSEDKPDLSASDQAEDLLKYNEFLERLEWSDRGRWQSSRAGHSLEGRHVVNPNIYRAGYLVTVPVDIVLAPVYATVTVAVFGWVICCFDGGK